MQTARTVCVKLPRQAKVHCGKYLQVAGLGIRRTATSASKAYSNMCVGLHIPHVCCINLFSHSLAAARLLRLLLLILQVHLCLVFFLPGSGTAVGEG